jgi:two-component system, response regulator PdtaR
MEFIALLLPHPPVPLQATDRVPSPVSRVRPTFAQESPSPSGSGKAAQEPAPILIVEDEYLVALEMEGALRDAGFSIVGVASSGEEAVALAAARNPALVVMDIRLNGRMDGIDAALQMFRTHGTRCVFATAHSDEHARTRAEPARPFAWLQKPFTMQSLVVAIRGALRNSAT